MDWLNDIFGEIESFFTELWDSILSFFDGLFGGDE